MMRPIVKFDPQFGNVPHPRRIYSIYLKAWDKCYHEPKHTYYATTIEMYIDYERRVFICKILKIGMDLMPRSTPTSRHKIEASLLGVMFTNIRCHPNTLGKFFAKLSNLIMDGGIIFDGKTNGKKWSLFLFLKFTLDFGELPQWVFEV